MPETKLDINGRFNMSKQRRLDLWLLVYFNIYEESFWKTEYKLLTLFAILGPVYVILICNIDWV